MKILPKQQTTSNAATLPLVKLGASHGYTFDGDIVRLNAMFSVRDPEAHQRPWRLQLWACPTAPASASELTGHLVAEVALPPIGEVADDTESFEMATRASIPAGQVDHVMVMALASGKAGGPAEIHDFAVYSRPERFLHPRFLGQVGFRAEGCRVVIEFGSIENPREAANLSGTLAVELWALAAPYAGGAFTGVPLAGVAIDSLPGQHTSGWRAFDLPYTPPPAGRWHVALMLREWTAAGYATRDFANFALPITVAAPVSEPSRAATPPPAAPAKTAAPAKPAQPKGSSDSSTVSVNRASKEELAAIKGLPAKVADEIVSKRPFRSLEDLTQVKGMGAKLLAKLRSKLKL